MLEKYQSFFAEDGITATSANHLCNIAREYVALAKADISRLSFIELNVGILGSFTAPVTIHHSVDNIAGISDYIDKISKSNAFIAYMQEAIKAKDKMFDEIQNMGLEEYVKEKNIKLPECPCLGDHKSFSDFFSELNIKEKSRYYALEAEAAVVGKTIHPDSPFHVARKNMFEAMAAPAYVEGDKIYYRNITIEKEDVEKLYFELQKRHRALEAELNSIKNSIDLKVKEYNAAVDNDYTVKWNEYSVEAKAIQNEFSNWKNEETKKIGKLKIAIPEALKESYEFLSNL